MEKQSVSELAQSWYQSSRQARSTDPARNKLFEMLYNAHCRRTGTGEEYSALTDHHKACTRLFSWYRNRYGDELQMPTGTRGQKRAVNCGTEEYTFDLLYCDDRQFRNYLEGGLPQNGTQDLLAFVLHTAVAFLVPLWELDEVLQQLGFHPLHVKNIHHLAIAYVLLMADPNGAEPGYNPFAEVRRLYFLGRRILRQPDAPAEEAYHYADLETRMIRDMLLLRRGLAAQNYEALVARNRAALNMRHSMILSDFHKLSAVFIHVFDSNSGPDAFEMPEEGYSFYRFVAQFCKEDLSRKKYREQLTSMIDLNQKHPTRNVLILLWLYTYCFSFLPGVIIEKNTFRRITKLLKKTDPKWEEQAKACYQDDLFDVYGFLTNQPQRSVPRNFRGADFVSYINEKLTLRYGWGPLNAKLPFDHYILKLENLTLCVPRFYAGDSCAEAEYDHRRLEGLPEEVDNVPAPLVAITGIFSELKDLHTVQSARSRYTAVSPCPLKCNLYEQL